MAINVKPCGECAACCTVLGVEALKKYAGRTCKHLDGRIPDKRCSIYDKRPEACSTYICEWKSAKQLGDEFRPDRVGFIITGYYIQEKISLVIQVFNSEKAGHPLKVETPLNTVIKLYMEIGINDLKVIWANKKTALWFAPDGDIHIADILPQKKFEDLRFQTTQLLGQWKTVRRGEEDGAFAERVAD